MDGNTLFSPIDEEADLDDNPLEKLLKKSMLMQKQQGSNNKSNALEDAQNSKTLTNDETVTLTEQDESSNDFVLVDLVKI